MPLIDPAEITDGNRRALARAITLVESSRADHRQQAEQLLSALMPKTGQSIRLGISGAPGVGKSTFIEAFGQYLVGTGKKIAVLAVDPSSTITGGSILGDKTRMESLSNNANVFIRPSPSGLSLGGVARRTQETILLCEAAGYDLIIVETVGVGQSEVLVSQMTDVFLLLLLPAAGDELQGIKRGIMELADIIAVNKADGDLEARANHAAADVKRALNLLHPRLKNWSVPVIATSAINNQGMTEVYASICDYLDALEVDEQLETRRAQQRKNWLWREVHESLLQALRSADDAESMIEAIESAVLSGDLPASQGARQLVKNFLENSKQR